MLRAIRGVLRAMLSELSDAWLDAGEGRNTWSPQEVVAHLAGWEEED
jgi:hypothetical protein